MRSTAGNETSLNTESRFGSPTVVYEVRRGSARSGAGCRLNCPLAAPMFVLALIVPGQAFAGEAERQAHTDGEATAYRAGDSVKYAPSHKGGKIKSGSGLS